LVNAATNTDIREVLDSEILTLSNLPPELNLRAEADPQTESAVVFFVNGFLQQPTQNRYPYALGGDFFGDYYPTPMLQTPTANLRIEAVPYLNEVQGIPGTINLKIVA
jgi:hypothetical protein